MRCGGDKSRARLLICNDDAGAKVRSELVVNPVELALPISADRGHRRVSEPLRFPLSNLLPLALAKPSRAASTGVAEPVVSSLFRCFPLASPMAPFMTSQAHLPF